ncbi:MAG: hypothetical protein L0Z50_12655 [Verrucomicrobiales bacterium]|nr:hypothetical protein [Verrucomicrobiales bacterium]
MAKQRPVGEKGCLNLYAFVCNDPWNKVDALGKYPGLPGHGSLFNPTDASTLLGTLEAVSRMASGSSLPPLSIRTLLSVFSELDTNDRNRFVYTCKYGFVDMGHFFNNAVFTLAISPRFAEWASTLNEKGQAFVNSDSAWGPEDLVSNDLGRRFANAMDAYESKNGAGSFSLAGEWRQFLVDAGAVAWNGKVGDSTVEQLLNAEGARYAKAYNPNNPLQFKTIEAGLQYQKAQSVHACLCDGDKPRSNHLMFK